MKRRGFISRLASGLFAFSILPSAKLYERVFHPVSVNEAVVTPPLGFDLLYSDLEEGVVWKGSYRFLEPGCWPQATTVYKPYSGSGSNFVRPYLRTRRAYGGVTLFPPPLCHLD